MKTCKCGKPTEAEIYSFCYDCWWAQDPRNPNNRVVKQVIVVRKDLNMRKGKMIAQGAHASVNIALTYQESRYFKQWLDTGTTKIALGVISKEQLLELFSKALDANIPTSLVTDRGSTEFKGVPTITALAIGPWDAEEIDKITGELSLL